MLILSDIFVLFRLSAINKMDIQMLGDIKSGGWPAGRNKEGKNHVQKISGCVDGIFLGFGVF